MLWFLFCSGVLVLLPPALSQKVDNGTLRIELVRHKSALEQHLNAPDLKDYGLNFDELFKKHHHKGDNRTNDSIALYRWFDNEFYGQVVIGHPGQTLNVAFDTAWTLSWVLSAECNVYKNIGCWFHRKYDHIHSSEYKPDNRPYNGNEGSFNLTGFFSYENFSIAHSNATAQSFVEMVSVPWTFIFNKIDGVLGLGLKTGAYDPDRQSSRGGNIMLGFIDSKHIHVTKGVKDQIKYLPVDPGQYWKFTVDSILLRYNKTKPDLTLCPNGCKAISDTSSNTIVGPEADVSKIHKKINAHNIFLNRYAVECETVNKLPKIEFILGGQPFQLEGPQYIIKLSWRAFTLCLSALVPASTTSEEGLWVLGGAFLSEYYSIYRVDNKQIGFVKAA
ncbi:hypothetical protein NQ315_007063 [Exocentrus adspersus]|uniref:Peptidase A1 domain-containing protein n=1 Tax=Exocentrus adspersus TaxID=1586481 RepID=A0AAV8WCJ3_9CUCU|nr:hypothetical protein NQ315_007063 [Exocentrus adspersus]